jgi:diguanylate cyclase (GGDEF)-like protein/PAS domain S-box-containing protein
MYGIEKPGFLRLHPKYRKAVIETARILLVLAAIQLIVWLIPARSEFTGIPYYLPLHTLLETVSIVVSMMVFVVGWNSHGRILSGNIILLAGGFFSVGVLDFLHTVSYGGMPDFISPNDAQKHLNFWLSARLMAAAVLLVVTIRSWKPISSNVTRYLIFGSLLAITGLINWTVVYHQAWLPDTFIPGQGLTAFKKTAEYTIIAINIVTAILLWTKMREPQPFKLVFLFGAVCTLAMSEFFFTLYTTMTGSYNVLGHIYKVIAYIFIYRAIVVEVIEEPYNLLEHEKRKFHNIFDSVNDGIELISPDGRIVDMNRADHERMGYTKEEVVGKTLADFTAPEYADSYREASEQLKRQGNATFESARICKDGSVIPVEISSRIVELDGEQMLLGISRDISDRKRVETDARQYRALLQTAHDGFWMIDSRGFLLEANQAYAEISGYSVDELRGMHVTQLEAEQSEDEVKAHIAKVIAQGYDVFETQHRHKDGHLINIEVSTSYLSEAQQFVAFCRDISSRKKAEEKIELLAFYDPLTHLPNRRLLSDRLQHALVSNVRGGKTGALLFIDLDNFKSLNDSLGHDVGDLLLQRVAERLTACVREGDTVARLGGDEFVVLLEDLSPVEFEAATQTEIVAHKILFSLNRLYQLGTHAYHNTPSIGAALFGKSRTGIEDVLKQADIAMYQAKNAGRNTFRFFDAEMQSAIINRVELEAALRQALHLKQFQLYYQIQMDDQFHPTGAEALIRWRHPVRGLVSPAQFIPLAEESRLILSIGDWVLDAACAQLKAWQQAELTSHLTLSVNVSAKQFKKENFVAFVQDTVQRHGIDPKLLKLEPTESILLENIEEIVATMNALKAIGVYFALDDFGTGFSSLQYLKRLPLNQLKIDQSFVRDLVSDSSDLAIVRTIIAMAHSLNLDVIAEGVETEQQRLLLLANGCNHFQGYLFGRPLPIAEFEATIRQGRPPAWS